MSCQIYVARNSILFVSDGERILKRSPFTSLRISILLRLRRQNCFCSFISNWGNGGTRRSDWGVMGNALVLHN